LMVCVYGWMYSFIFKASPSFVPHCKGSSGCCCYHCSHTHTNCFAPIAPKRFLCSRSRRSRKLAPPMVSLPELPLLIPTSSFICHMMQATSTTLPLLPLSSSFVSLFIHIPSCMLVGAAFMLVAGGVFTVAGV